MRQIIWWPSPSTRTLTPYFLVLLRTRRQLLWHSQEVLGLFQPGGSQEVGCHHTSGRWPDFHILDNILLRPQPHSRGLLQADQLKVPPVSQWPCILETLNSEKEGCLSSKVSRKGIQKNNSHNYINLPMNFHYSNFNVHLIHLTNSRPHLTSTIQRLIQNLLSSKAHGHTQPPAVYPCSGSWHWIVSVTAMVTYES